MAEKKGQFDQRKYIQRWQKENLCKVTVALSKIHDADIIRYLSESGKNKSAYIKTLIRADMKRDEGN